MNTIKLPIMLETTITMSLLFLNTCFVLKLTYTENYYKWFHYSMGVLLLLSFIPRPYNYILQSLIFPVVLVTTVIIKDKLYTNIKTIIISYVFVIISKQLLSVIKTGYINFELVNLNAVTALCYSLDLYLIYVFIIKGVKSYGLFLEFLFLSKKKSVQESSNTLQGLADDYGLVAGQRIKFFALAAGYQFLQLFIVLCIGLMNNMFVELNIILINFWIGRKILGNCWHSDTLWICSISTFTSFYILVKVTPPLHISLFMCVITSGLFVWVMYILGYKSERLEYLEDAVEPVMVFAKTLRDLNFLEKDIIFICEIKFLNKSVKEQASKYSITEKSIKNRRTELYKQLNEVGIKIK